MAEQIFLSPEVKRSVIISNKYAIYELPQELPNDLRLRILGNWETSRKPQNFIKLLSSAESSSENEDFINTSEKLLKNRNRTFPVVRCFT